MSSGVQCQNKIGGARLAQRHMHSGTPNLLWREGRKGERNDRQPRKHDFPPVILSGK